MEYGVLNFFWNIVREATNWHFQHLNKNTWMKIFKITVFTLFCLLLSGCEKDDKPEGFWVEAKVLKPNIGCDAWEIQDLNHIDSENDFGIFNEIGLPDQYKVEGLELQLKIREAREDEVMICLAIGIPYPLRVITDVKEK